MAANGLQRPICFPVLRYLVSRRLGGVLLFVSEIRILAWEELDQFFSVLICKHIS